MVKLSPSVLACDFSAFGNESLKKYLAVSVMSVKMVLVRNVREIRKRQLVLMVLQRLSELRRIHAVR